ISMAKAFTEAKEKPQRSIVFLAVTGEEQGLLESRIAEIEDIILNAELIKATKSSKVILGSKVELKTGKKTVSYTIVGPVEANPLEGKISNESPIGVALMGKKVGDHATITTPKGEIAYEITAI
ncbi:MAG: GreA/GreB family elongation factor, partial [Candidatus Saccharimonadales bacterium]